jgi:tetratricopeptide (TPR) repeat protein
MYCKNCGEKSDGTQRFCTKCGAAFASTSNPITQPAPPKRAPMPKERWTTGRIIKTILVVVFVGGLLLLKFGLSAINSVDNTAVETNNKALEAFDSGNNSQAIDQFKQASQGAVTDANKINSLKNLAYVYSTEGQNDLALSTFNEALELVAPDSFDYYLISGEVALLEGKPNSALIAYNKAYAKDPENFQINNALALFYIDIGDLYPQYVDYRKALEHAKKANQLSNTSLSKKNLALAHYFNEEYHQTITLLKSVDINKEPYYAYYLGLAYVQIEDTFNAKLYLRQAIAGGAVVPQEVHDYINSH